MSIEEYGKTERRNESLTTIELWRITFSFSLSLARIMPAEGYGDVSARVCHCFGAKGFKNFIHYKR